MHVWWGEAPTSRGRVCKARLARTLAPPACSGVQRHRTAAVSVFGPAAARRDVGGAVVLESRIQALGKSRANPDDRSAAAGAPDGARRSLRSLVAHSRGPSTFVMLSI